MKYYIGVSDKIWFDFLTGQQPDEVNFWQPGGTTNFRALKPGEPFLFKLHSPLNYIVGGGFFVKHSLLPLSIAWQAFGQKNGTPDLLAFYQQIKKYRDRSGTMKPDPTIGCIILANPFFFPQAEWLPVPSNWSSNLVQGKTYDTADQIGSQLWQQVEDRLQIYSQVIQANRITEQHARYSAAFLTRTRLGQGAFRVLVTDAYERRCAITGERTLPVLQAAHIQPYAESGPHSINNGVLLRSDLHILFDQGYLTINPQLKVEVSQRIKEEYANGKEYYALHGRPLTVLPADPTSRPSVQFIEWHNQHVYLP